MANILHTELSPPSFQVLFKKKKTATVFILYKQVQYSVFLWSLTKWFRLNFTKTSGLPCKSIVIIFSTPAQDFPQFLLRSKHLELNTDSLFCCFFLNLSRENKTGEFPKTTPYRSCRNWLQRGLHGARIDISYKNAWLFQGSSTLNGSLCWVQVQCIQ